MSGYDEMSTAELLAVPPGEACKDGYTLAMWAAALRDRLAEAEQRLADHEPIVRALRAMPEQQIVSYHPDDRAWYCGLCGAENDHYPESDHYLSCPWWLARQTGGDQ